MKISEEEKRRLIEYGWKQSDIDWIEEDSEPQKITLRQFNKKNRDFDKSYEESHRIELKYL